MPVEARPCFACSRQDAPVTHKYKAIHLRLDHGGDVFVSEGIYQTLLTVPTMAGLEVVPGRNAPSQIIGAVEQPTQRIVFPNGEKYVPGWNKYQAEQRMQRPLEPIAEKIQEMVDRKATAALAQKRSLFIMGRRK